MSSATIKLFLVHGEPKHLRTAELSNWSGKAVAGPRSELDDLLKRDEARSTGIYLLIGTDSASGAPAVYVGEAESIRGRLRSHTNKDFWNQVVFFVSKDENLTKAHVRFLEGRLIEQAGLTKRAQLMNGQSSGSKLPESDREDMEVFLDKILQLLPVLGIDSLLPVATRQPAGAEDQMLFCDIKGLRATGYLAPAGLVVSQGSQAVIQERESAQRYPSVIAARRQMIEDGTLEDKGDHFVFSEDVEFTSPSAAATVIHGGSANGLLAWKTEDGRSLKDFESGEHRVHSTT